MPPLAFPPQHELLAQRLLGQELHIPSLSEKFEHWVSQGSNPDLDKLRVHVNLMISNVTADPRVLQAAAESDMGLLTCLWYPWAEWAELKTAAAYLAWVFLWDDEIDLGISETSKSLSAGREYCEKSLNYIQEIMGFSQSTTWADTVPYPCMEIFKRFGSTLRDTVDKDQRRCTYHGLRHYVRQVRVEHSRQLEGIIPNPREYLEMRSGTAGVAPVCACAEYMNRVELPEWVRNSEEMALMSKESTMLCLLINDLYSAPKEISARTFQNYITVLMNDSPSKSLDSAVKNLISDIDRSIQSFDTAFASLDAKTQHNNRLNHDLRLCVDSRRQFVTGLITWTLVSSRYKLRPFIQDDGSVVVPLELV